MHLRHASLMLAVWMINIKGSVTHLQLLQISIKFIPEIEFYIRRILWNF